MKKFIGGVFGLLIFLLVVSSFVFDAFETQERARAAAEKTIQVYKEDSLEAHAIKATLMLAYDLSDPEAEFFAYWFNKKSRQFRIPWMTFAAVTKVESDFNPTLTSPVGAKGYMQLMDDTHAEQCQKLGIPFVKGKTPWIDVLNIVCGTNYLAESKDTTFEVMVKRYLAPLHAQIKKKAKKEKNEWEKARLEDVVVKIDKYYRNVRREFMLLNAIYAGIKK